MSARVVLVGPRGAGKSAVGPLLAARLGVGFRDADAEVERETGRAVADLLREGEFRAAEVRVLALLLAGGPAVVAAGGGAVLWDGFAAAAAGWTVVWLDADPAVLAARIRADARARPSLTGRPPDEEVGAVRAARAARYGAAASFRIDTGRLEPEQVARGIEKLLTGEPNAGFDRAD